jgi:hypothetical protein
MGIGANDGWLDGNFRSSRLTPQPKPDTMAHWGEPGLSPARTRSTRALPVTSLALTTRVVRAGTRPEWKGDLIWMRNEWN